MSVRPALLFVASSFVLCGFGRCETPVVDPIDTSAPWQLVWSDEFDGPAGQKPDAARWTHDVGGHGWGNNQLEYDTDRAENASLDGQGNLAIVARAESYGGRNYTSARIKTQGLFERTFGRFEARLKLPSGQGVWPAFWLLGADIGTTGWPACGEIDVMEYRGQTPLTTQGSLHGPGYSGGGAIWTQWSLPGPAGFDDDFHVFAVDWDPARLRWEVDGEVFQTVTADHLPGGAPWVFDSPFFIILNVAVGGGFVGSPDATTRFPQSMLVDYVRVYQRGA